MKKLLPILMLMLLVLTGCSEKENKKLNLSSVESKLAGLAYSVDDNAKTIDLIFKENMTVTDEYVQNVYKVDFDNIQDYLISMPSSKDTAEMYAIVLPKEGKDAIVKKEMDEFIEKYQNEYKETNHSQMTENVLKQTYGRYLIYVISNKSETVYNTITGN